MLNWFVSIQNKRNPKEYAAVTNKWKKNIYKRIYKAKQGRTQGGVWGESTTQPTPPIIKLNPYPKPLKHSNKTKLSLNESKNNSLKIYFLIIKTHFSQLKINILFV